jgi:haloalkane dehalogenase
MEYSEHRVPRGAHRIYAREYGGEGSAVVLMHGFPDNLHLYDRLTPYLSGRRVVSFDFLGWGGSDKPAGYPYTADNQSRDLDAVIGHLGLEDVVLVAHDASGPPAIDWALWHPERTAALVLLNTYYGRTLAARPPEAIFLFSTPVLRNVARLVSGRFDLFRRMYWWQVGRRFIRDEEVRKEFVPLLYEQFAATPSTKPAFFSLNADLWGTMRSRSGAEPEMRAFERPVRILFGEADPYLNAGVARHFHDLFPNSELFLLPTARHFPQLDEPEEVARLILSTPLAEGFGPAVGDADPSDYRRGFLNEREGGKP